MALKNQFQKLKENWLLLALVVVVLVVFSGLNPTQTFTNKIAMDESVDLTASRSSSFVPYYDNFAPEAAQRFITKTSSLSTEIKRNTFQETDSKVKDLTKGFNAIIINENQNKNGEGKTSYLSSSYTMKVETSKYDSLVSQLKTIGEITYFNENSDDITEQKLDLQTSLEAERERLARYKQLLETAQTTQEKIELTDKIFEEERTIKYYEEALENVNNQVSYSTVYLTITEKRSDFANAAFIKFSQIVTSFVDSINSLINLIFVLIPWAIALLIIWLIYRKFKN
ncbi:DUF4349 domain-containing protein [Candidatus Woesearchaeota archaeon]|nr:DUF4349 domain-containing protein [Candidatus Woesearchaeota archaeon]